MVYSEKQVFRYSGKWYALSIVVFLIIAGFFSMLMINIKEINIIALVILSIVPLIIVCVYIYISSLELNIKIDSHGLNYQLIPIHDGWVFIPRTKMLSYRLIAGGLSSVTKVSKGLQTVWWRKNKRYMVLGNHLLELSLMNDRKIGLTTLHPKKIGKAIQQLLNKK